MAKQKKVKKLVLRFGNISVVLPLEKNEKMIINPISGLPISQKMIKMMIRNGLAEIR